MEQIFTQDGNGNIIDITASNISWLSQSFAYDGLNRLISASGSYGTIDFSYDKVGNRLTREAGGQIDGYAYVPGTNRLSQITGPNAAIFSYDASGNITAVDNRSFIYNQNNRLIRVEEGTEVLGEYTYNALGQRVLKDADGAVTIFLYDFDGNIVAESRIDGEISFEYLYMGTNRIAMADVSTGRLYYFNNNYLGTPLLITDSDGNVVWDAQYKPFGEAEVSEHASVVNSFRFAGQYFDEETGLHYNWHRYYDPKTGRYLTADPIGLAGGINLFLYADGNPINVIDPFGLSGIAIDFGGDYTTGWGGEVNPNAPVAQGGTAGTGVYFGAKNWYAEFGGFTYTADVTNTGKTPAASLGAGLNITIYLTDAENFFPGKMKYINYVIGPFALTFFEDPCTGELKGITSSLLGKGFGWVIHEEGYSYGLQGALQ